MKKIKNAFTLIELLAVIIILAIVALIATPIILNVIEDARISAGRSEANMILGGINNYCATEEIKSQMDSNYSKICTSSMDSEDVKEMVNLGNADIKEIVYDGKKLTTLVIESNNHKFTLCPSGQFAMDDEKCKGGNVAITTGPIKDVVLSNFPYLETNGNGCVTPTANNYSLTPTANNYSYMGGCYIKGSSQSGKDMFYSMMNQMGMDNNTITQMFFNSEGNFIEENFNKYITRGMTEDEINQMLQEAGVSTIFELVTIETTGNPMTSKELFAQQAINNNYLWYSGFLWRIMGINADGTVRLITDENVTTIPLGIDNSAKNWDDSYTKEWLNNYFYPRLKENNIISEQIWCSEITTDILNPRIDCTNNLSTTKMKVGLITMDEFILSGAIKSYLDIKNIFWTMTPYSNSDMLVILTSGDGNLNKPVSDLNGVRPVINVNFDVTITGGNGTLGETWSSQSGPYILNEDKSVEITGKLNEQVTSGEYVMYAGRKYRVVDKDSNGNTKLILDGYYEEDGSIFEMKYNDTGYYEEDGSIFEMKYNDTSTNVFSTTTGIGQKLNGDVLNWLTNNSESEKAKLVSNYTWYQNNFGYGDSFTISLNEESPTRSVNATVGLIRVGEMLSSQSSSILTKGYTTTSSYSNATTYWTMTPYTTSSDAWYVGEGGYSDDRSVSYAFGLRAVIVVNSDVTITGGNGTWSNPYQLS